jgi:hypothetical protein
MTTFSRLALGSAAALLLTVASAAAHTSQAAPLFTVAIAPAQSVAAVGSDGIFMVELTGASDSYPNLEYDVTGGQVTGVVALNATASGQAEGEVHVRRDTPGTATLTASFAGQVLATGDLRFAQLGAVSVTVSVDGGPDAAARTWLFEVTNTSGTVVDRMRVGTSGDEPTATMSSSLVPYGYYGVRQVLGNDTKLTCGAGAFYQVTAPVTAETTLQLADSNVTANFAIHVCAGTPALSVDIPVDPIQPAANAGTLGDAYPGETPVNEVRGARQPGTPLPPNTGTGLEPVAGNRSNDGLLFLGFMLLTVPTLGVASVAAVRVRRR